MELEKIKSIVDDYVVMQVGDVINCFRLHYLIKSFNELVSAHLDEKLKSPRQKNLRS